MLAPASQMSPRKAKCVLALLTLWASKCTPPSTVAVQDAFCSDSLRRAGLHRRICVGIEKTKPFDHAVAREGDALRHGVPVGDPKVVGHHPCCGVVSNGCCDARPLRRRYS